MVFVCLPNRLLACSHILSFFLLISSLLFLFIFIWSRYRYTVDSVKARIWTLALLCRNGLLYQLHQILNLLRSLFQSLIFFLCIQLFSSRQRCTPTMTLLLFWLDEPIVLVTLLMTWVNDTEVVDRESIDSGIEASSSQSLSHSVTKTKNNKKIFFKLDCYEVASKWWPLSRAQRFLYLS